MPFKPAWKRMSETRRTPLDINPRAIILRLTPSGFYIPMGMRSKLRLRRLLTPTNYVRQRIRSPILHHLFDFSQGKPVRSIHNDFFFSFVKFARWQRFPIYIKQGNTLVPEFPDIHTETALNNFEEE